jgi:MFS superfamily sulfate permease-like transporter
VLAVTAMGRGVLANLPTAALGALVVFAALRLINFAVIPTWGHMALGAHERTADA